MEKKISRSEMIFAAILAVIIISNIAIFVSVNQKIDRLESKVTSDISLARQDFKEGITNAALNDARERALLENRTLTNLKTLEGFFKLQNSMLKLNLESQLGSVANDLDKVKEDTQSDISSITEQVSGLEDKVSEINVQSSDFSSIIDDVIKAVVSVKTNNGQGSGVFFTSDGYIMTNKHVISGATTIQVVDYNSQTYNVRLVGAAQNADLAVLKIESNKTFDYLLFEDSPNIKVGNRVIAVGNPLGLSFTVTEGVISALNRVIDETNVGYIQTDVSINAGNSGGPLIDSAKKIVGINTLKALESEGIGFAIPASAAKEIADQAIGQ